MLKNSLIMQLAVVGALVAGVAGGMSFLYLEAGPYLFGEFPAIQQIHDNKPYLVQGLLSLASLLLSFAVLAQFSSLKHWLASGLGRLDVLSEVVSASAYSSDAGVLYLDADRRVLTASALPVRLSGSRRVTKIQGKRCKDLYPEKFARLLSAVMDNAQSSRRQVAVEVSDWSPYGELGLDVGPMNIVATPAYKGSRFAGFTVIFRSTKEIRLAEHSAALYQQNYQILFDTLQLGVAVFKPVVRDNGAFEVYLVEANAAFKRALDGVPLPGGQSVSEVWPGFMAQPQLHEGISKLLTGEQTYQSEIFYPALGKYFEVWLAAMPEGRMLSVISDLTEFRIHEKQVLALNDRLQRNLAGQREYLASILDDIQYFNQATADVAEAPLQRLARVSSSVPPPLAGEITSATSALHQVLHQMIRYHDSANLPYRASTLVHSVELVGRIQDAFRKRYPHIEFSIGPLPSVVASPEVLYDVLEQLISSLARLSCTGPARIVVEGHSGFLDTGISVSGYGFDTTELVIDVPPDMEPLDWTMTSDLNVALIRRMVREHGGQLTMGQAEQGDGIRLRFTIGSPD